MSTLKVDTIQDKGAAFEHARLVQVVNTETGAVATGTTNAVADNTIPQNTEGDEYMTLAITPTNTNNKLLIQGSKWFDADTMSLGRVLKDSHKKYKDFNYKVPEQDKFVDTKEKSGEDTHESKSNTLRGFLYE